LLRLQTKARAARGGLLQALLAGALVAALPALLDASLRLPAYRIRLGFLGSVAGPTQVVALYGLVLACAALLYAALLAIPRIGRGLTAGVVGAAFALQMGIRSAFGEFGSEREIASLAASDAGLSLAAITSFFSAEMALWGVVGAGLALATLRVAQWAAPAATLPRAAGLVAAALVAHGALWNVLYRKCHSFPVEPVLHSLRAAAYFEKERREFLSIPRDLLAAPSVPSRPDDNVVVVLDESVRYGFLSINDPSVGTTPFLLALSRRHPGFRDYGLMLAASTCSMSSEAMLLTGTTRAPDRERRALRNPTLFQYAQHHGYRTVLLDAWGTAFPNNVMRASDLRFVDEHLGGERIDPGAHPDLAAAAWTRRRISASRGNFVFILKRGAHFHYERAYPSHDPAQRRFAPTLRPGESYGASRERMINSYKNAVAFSVDAFLRHLVPDDLNGTTILWLSDHGQSLQEQGQTYTHCKREIEQAIVPFFTLSGSDWVLANQPAAQPRQAIFYSHHNIYPTLISLFAKDREFTHGGFHSLFAPEPIQPPLYYLYGGLWGGSTVIRIEPVRLAALVGAGRARGSGE
jgi:glucan phosphoethanolaminetransferase (alkaline phosphatase superfamily)